MRIFLPLDPGDLAVLTASRGRLELAADRPAWAVTEEARRERPGVEEEVLDDDALLDAVHVALSDVVAADPAQRALVIAADVPDRDLVAATDTGGAYGVRTAAATTARIAAVHVTELDAASAVADDTDPALLWFDVSEGAAALAYRQG